MNYENIPNYGSDVPNMNGPGFVPPPPPPPPNTENCTPVPPPVPPIKYCPGMNIQEQLGDMAARVNTCINRWNAIQEQCYKTLDQVVGAAVNNDVYYSPDEIRFTEGYSEDAGCPYSLVIARAVDRAGRPIFCHLRPAYNNVTNSGARENIQDVSFVTSAQLAMTAFQASETHWAGTSLFNGQEGNSAQDETVWVAGWNRNGVLRFFMGDVTQEVMRLNRMVNCIGPVFPILQNGQPFSQVVNSMGEVPGSIQAMGWMNNGNKVFFSCGLQDNPGMTPTQVMKILQNIGCMTAVITSYQTTPVSSYTATPIAGTANTVPSGGDASDVIQVPGMTGGMIYLGKMTTAPLQWSIPANAAAWVVTKRPTGGWRNAFTTEVANVVQQLGNTQNSMASLTGQFQSENDAISKLQFEVDKNASDIGDLNNQITGFDTRIAAAESKVDNLETQVTALSGSVQTLTTAIQEETQVRTEQVEALNTALKQETDERKAADKAITAAVNAEKAARESADTILQNNIDTETSAREAADAALSAEIDSEATTRAKADKNLQAAIEAEESARSTKDTQHEAQIAAVQAKAEQDVAAVQQEINTLKDGSALPIASKTQIGAIKVGDNLVIESDGTLNAMASSGGDTIAEGPGIKITTSSTGVKTVSADTTVLATNTSVQADINTALSTAISPINQEIQTINAELQDANGSIENITADLETEKTKITALQASSATMQTDISNLKSGEALPVATATTLGGVKIGANLSISADGVLSGAAPSSEGQDTHTLAAGEGVSVEYADETHVYTVSLNQNTRDTLSEIPDIKSAINQNAAKITANTTAITALDSKVDTTKSTLETQISANASNITNLMENDQNITAEITDIKAVNTTQGTQIANNATAITQAKAAADTAKTAADTAQASADTNAAAIAAANTEISKRVPTAGGTMTGGLKLQGAKLLIADASGTVVGELRANGGVLTLSTANAAGNAILRGIATPTNSADAVPKNYVDSAISPVSTTANNANTAAAAAQAAAETAQNDASTALSTAQTAGQNASTALTTANAASTAAAGKVSKTGDTMTGELAINGQFNTAKLVLNGTLTNGTPKAKGTLTAVGFTVTPTDGTTVNGLTFFKSDDSTDVGFNASNITRDEFDDLCVRLAGIAAPQFDHEAANKAYVDAHAGGEKIGIAHKNIQNQPIKYLDFNFGYTPKTVLVFLESVEATSVISTPTLINVPPNSDVISIGTAKYITSGSSTFKTATMSATPFTGGVRITVQDKLNLEGTCIGFGSY